jgi:hypothetical protein
VRHLEHVEPDALLTATDLGVELPVQMRAHTTVAGARAAAGRHHGGGGAVRKVRWSVGGATRRLKLPSGWVRVRASFNSVRWKRRSSFRA